MTEENKDNKFKRFLVDGFQALDRHDEDVTEEGVEYLDDPASEDTVEEQPASAPAPEGSELVLTLKALETEMIRIRYMLEDMKSAEPAVPDLSGYMTNREQFKAVTAAVEKRNSDSSNKTLVKAMEAISVMREDFFKLCQGMRGRIDELSPETVLSSFEAYSVDMENILEDGGVYIGAFPYDKLNTLHQRIVGVVPTGDAETDGHIAERISDGYKMGDKVLLKERVTVYKFDPSLAPKAEETVCETGSEITSETASDNAGTEPVDKETAKASQEEEE